LSAANLVAYLVASTAGYSAEQMVVMMVAWKVDLKAATRVEYWVE